MVNVRSRPVLAQPQRMFEHLSTVTDEWVARGRRSLDHQLTRASDDLDHRLARVQALSPLATLERGYAVVQSADGTEVLTDAGQVEIGDRVTARLARGRLVAVVEDTQTEGRHIRDERGLDG
ncbi:MAG: exodeoxyribonuclease VII large subunit [Nocardioidaceae bacterium]